MTHSLLLSDTNPYKCSLQSLPPMDLNSGLSTSSVHTLMQSYKGRTTLHFQRDMKMSSLVLSKRPRICLADAKSYVWNYGCGECMVP